jgi:hypothetical protein
LIPGASRTAAFTSEGVPAEPPGDTTHDQPGVIHNRRRRLDERPIPLAASSRL